MSKANKRWVINEEIWQEIAHQNHSSMCRRCNCSRLKTKSSLSQYLNSHSLKLKRNGTRISKSNRPSDSHVRCASVCTPGELEYVPAEHSLHDAELFAPVTSQRSRLFWLWKEPSQCADLIRSQIVQWAMLKEVPAVLEYVPVSQGLQPEQYVGQRSIPVWRHATDKKALSSLTRWFKVSACFTKIASTGPCKKKKSIFSLAQRTWHLLGCLQDYLSL